MYTREQLLRNLAMHLETDKRAPVSDIVSVEFNEADGYVFDYPSIHVIDDDGNLYSVTATLIGRGYNKETS